MQGCLCLLDDIVLDENSCFTVLHWWKICPLMFRRHNIQENYPFGKIRFSDIWDFLLYTPNTCKEVLICESEILLIELYILHYCIMTGGANAEDRHDWRCNGGSRRVNACSPFRARMRTPLRGHSFDLFYTYLTVLMLVRVGRSHKKAVCSAPQDRIIIQKIAYSDSYQKWCSGFTMPSIDGNRNYHVSHIFVRYHYF